MRKLIVIGITGLLILSGCTDKKKLEEAQKQNDATRAELIEAVSDRDQLLSLVNEISAGMDQIKQLENILSVSGKNETPGQRERIQSDIAAIQQTLQ